MLNLQVLKQEFNDNTCEYGLAISTETCSDVVLVY